MEDVAKALYIAAGLFLAVLLLSLLVMFYNEAASYYTSEHEATLIEQGQKFNARFQNYHRNNIRGSDLISLMNRVIDYNATEFEDKSYERIKVTITLGNDDILNQFKCDESSTKNDFLLKTITNTNGSNNWESDRQLIAITNTSPLLCNKLIELGVTNATDTHLQQLGTKTLNIVLDENAETDDSYIYNRFKRVEIIKDLLEIEIKVDEEKAITDLESKATLDKIENITDQYYQYTQFKRALFDCESMVYDQNTKRVEEMYFKLQTKIENGKETVVFD